MLITRRDARQTALLYLLMGLPGVPALAYLPRNFVVSGDAAATAQRIASGETVYRLIILGALVSMVFFIFLGSKLYQLFEEVDRAQARLLVSFVLISVALGVVDVICLLTPLVIQSGASSLAAFSPTQLDAMALGALSVRNALLGVDQTFWGLWLLPFGILVIKSGAIPKILGVFLIMGCVGWVAMSAIFIVAPHAHRLTNIAFMLAQPGELSMLGWLLLKSFIPQPAEGRLAYAQ
ncbi:MAG TPA: DUF4386 domain-containing protein [Gemmatimonadaceae bacterium]|nr:DUF4386 domain-containing protein [Gemmatimonadaceae bacterium]